MDKNKIKMLEDANIEWTSTLPKLLGKEDIYIKYLKRLLSNKYFDELTSALNNDKCAEAFELAHTLRGTVGSLGVRRMYDCIAEMTEDLRTSDIDAAKLRLAELTKARDEAFDAITKI